MTKKTIIFGVFIFMAFSINAQEYKFGKVSKEELNEKFYPTDSTASASVIYREQKTYFDYVQSSGFRIITQVFERVKIYNSDGFKYATVTENLYYDGGDSESMNQLKAYTYNLVNGEITKDKLKSSGQFTTVLNDYYKQEKFTMPNIKEGSVIEYQYTIISPFYWSVDEMILQYDIPIKKQEVSISAPEYFIFKPNMKGYLPVNSVSSSGHGKINFINKNRSSSSTFGSAQTGYSTSQLDYITNENTFRMNDVPALKEEPFINNINNYRTSVNYELQYVKMPQSPIENYTTSWEDVIEKIYESSKFGGQLTQGNFFKDDLNAILEEKNTDAEKVAAIFHFVQNHMNWDGYNGYYVKNGVRKAYKEQKGNIADINLMLIAMLKDAGIKSYPVLISTRDHGVPLFPTREGLNYVAAYVELDGNSVMLDASNKFTKPNLMPTRTLNWFGQIVKEDGTHETISLMPNYLSKEHVMCSVVVDQNGTIEGKQRTTYTNYLAYNHRNKFNSVDKDSYIEKLESEYTGIEINEYAVQNQDVVGKPIMESYEFLMDGQASIIGDKIYFNPLFQYASEENPFKLEERSYPIDFKYPWEERYIMNINIPEGFRIESVPESMNLALPENMGSFLYKVQPNGNSLQLMVDLKLNQAVITVQNYPFIKEFFKKVVEKETEQVVLSKISSDGTQQNTTGGR